MIRHYRFPGADRRLTTRNDAPEIDPIIDSFYRAYRSGSPDPDAATPAIHLRRRGREYHLTGPGGEWDAGTEADAVLYFEYELTEALLQQAAPFVHLHAAAVCDRRRCLLLIGPSGAGKSTLTLGMRLRGYRCLADDAALIDPASGAVQPFDRSIRVHEAGFRALGVDPTAVERGRRCGPYLWVDPSRDAEERRPRRPDVLLFLEPGSSGGLERLKGSETLRALLAARLGGSAECDFEVLARTAARAPGYRLRFKDYADALGNIEHRT